MRSTTTRAAEAERLATGTRQLLDNLRDDVGLDDATRDFLAFNLEMATDELQYVADELAVRR